MKFRFVLLSALVIVPFLTVLLTARRGGSVEFCPFTLRFRTQSEITTLNGAWVIYRSSWREHDNDVLRFIQQQGYVAPKERPPQWRTAWPGLQNETVIEWSMADPERARVYWEEAFQHLRSGEQSEIIGAYILRHGRDCATGSQLRELIPVIKKEAGDP